jgi:hypothetical protein
MDLPRRRFSKIRVWQICGIFREFARRDSPQSVSLITTWAKCAKLQRRYMMHKSDLANVQVLRLTDIWHFTVFEAIKSISQSTELGRKSWQTCAFQNLERMAKFRVQSAIKDQAAWQVCAVMSRRHLLRSAVDDKDDNGEHNWKQAVWRSDRLNKVRNSVNRAGWQIAFSIIAKKNFRARKFSWDKSVSIQTRRLANEEKAKKNQYKDHIMEL